MSSHCINFLYWSLWCQTDVHPTPSALAGYLYDIDSSDFVVAEHWNLNRCCICLTQVLKPEQTSWKSYDKPVQILIILSRNYQQILNSKLYSFRQFCFLITTDLDLRVIGLIHRSFYWLICIYCVYCLLITVYYCVYCVDQHYGSLSICNIN